jgi:hypothetical protein
MSKKEMKCKITLCEDPDTGMVIAVYDGHCPPGTIEKLAGKIAVNGMSFRKEEEKKKEEKETLKSGGT